MDTLTVVSNKGKTVYRDRAGNVFKSFSNEDVLGDKLMPDKTLGNPAALIVGGVKLIAGLVSNSRAKLMALKEQTGQLKFVLEQLEEENKLLDAEIAKVRQAIAQLSGLSGFLWWGKKPWFGKKKKEKKKIDTINADITKAKAAQAAKIATLQKLNTQYEALVAQQQAMQASVAKAGMGVVPIVLLLSVAAGTGYLAWKKSQKEKKNKKG